MKESKVFDITSLDTYALLTLFVNILGSKAWQNMGLRVNPGTDEAEKDLERARTAIDCIDFMIQRLEGHLERSEMSALRRVLSDLQINFVRVS